MISFAEFAFYLFAASTVAAALGVILARNPVHSVLCLIGAFVATSGLFVLMGAEYLAMLLVVVYVGAVAVLFLFVVMMLDVDFAELKKDAFAYVGPGLTVGIFLLVQIAMIVAVWQIPNDEELARSHPSTIVTDVVTDPDGPNNAESLGLVLYTDFVHFFQIAGIILLVAMIGAILLTFRERKGIRKQDVGRQVNRKREEGVELVEVKTGEGIKG